MPPIETETTSTSGKLPGISVSDAFGLPDDWSLAASLKGVASEREDISPKPEKREGTPDPAEMEQQRQAEKDAASEETDPEAAKDGESMVKAELAEAERNRKELEAKTKPPTAKEKSEAAKILAGGKKADKPADGKTAAKTTEKPAAGAKPAEQKKIEIPALGTEPKKVKVGDKEYTEDELKAALEGKPAAAKDLKVDLQQKQETKPVEKTADQIAQDQAKQKEMERQFLDGASKAIDINLDEKTLDTILTGGPDAVKSFVSALRETAARAVLAARRDIIATLTPSLNALDQLNQAHVQQENTRMETALFAAHPHLQDHADLTRQHAWALVKEHPEEVAKMTEEQFNETVADLTTKYIRRFAPDFGAPKEEPASAATTVAAKVTTEPAKTGTKRVTPKPPASSLPGSPAAGGKGRSDFAKQAIADML